jgi:hypothetical protein
MGLKKGMTNNPNGRPAGTPNKLTGQLRVRINDFLSTNWEKMQNDFDALEPKDRLSFYEKLLQYGLPKLQATQLTSDLERLTDEELDYIINDLKETIQ